MQSDISEGAIDEGSVYSSTCVSLVAVTLSSMLLTTVFVNLSLHLQRCDCSVRITHELHIFKAGIDKALRSTNKTCTVNKDAFEKPNTHGSADNVKVDSKISIAEQYICLQQLQTSVVSS